MNRPRASLRTTLVLISLVATLPLALLLSLRTLSDAHDRRELIASHLRTTARAVGRAVDGELAASHAALHGLAAGDALQRDDVAAFERRLRADGPMRPSWNRLVLLDADGRRRIELDPADGRRTAPIAAVEWRALAAAGARPPGTDVLIDGVDGADAPGTAWIGVTTTTGDGRSYLLAAQFGRDTWQAMLTELAPEGGQVTLFDARRRVVARTPDDARLVGRPLAAPAAGAIGSAPAGQATTALIEGEEEEAYLAWQRLRHGDWGVGVGTAAAPLDASQSRAVLSALGIALACVLLGVGLSLWVARHVATLLRERTDGGADAVAGLSAVNGTAARERDELMTREKLARQDAEAASRAKDELLSILGHELRNPLNALVTSAEVLRAAPPGSAIAESARAVVTRQTLKLSMLIDRLLEAGRLIAGEITLAMQPVELQAAAQAGLAVAMPQARERGHALDLVAPAPVWVQADPVRITQVIAQLLDNALRHTPPGAAITVELRRDGTDAVVTVRDTGPGIDPAVLPRVFEPFVQGRREPDQPRAGLGVGLAMVKRLVELQGGAIGVTSSAAGAAFVWRMKAIDPPDLGVTAHRAGGIDAAGSYAVAAAPAAGAG